MIEPKDTIKQLEDYKPPIDARLDKHRYDFNENVLGASPKAIEALRNIDPIRISTYPEYENYYRRISSAFGLKPNEIMLSNGTDEGIKLILETYMDRGDEMILPMPSFAMFKFYAQRIGIVINEILYNEDLTFPTDRVLKAITPNTRLVVLVNPNNPTATEIPQNEVETIVQASQHALVLIDEAYYDFANDNSLNLLQKYDNIILLRTFSKSIGLAGLRIGMAISRPSTIQVLKKSSSPYNVSALACHMAAAALEDREYALSYISKVKASRTMVSKQLTDWGFKVYPSSANFLLIDFGYMCQWIVRSLRSQKILVRDRSFYPLLTNCVRITLGASEDSERLLSAIDKALIFDMDGVLVDVSESYLEAIALTVEHFTKSKPSMESIQTKRNQGNLNNDWDLTQALIEDLGKDISSSEIVEVFQQLYLGTENDGLKSNETWLFPRGVLEQLHSQHPIFILTGRPRLEAEFALNNSGMKSFFDAMITLDDTPVGKSKPDPWGLNKLLLNFNGTRAMYFGDTVDDIRAALAANISAIGVIQRKENEAILRSVGAHHVIGINDILEVIQ